MYRILQGVRDLGALSGISRGVEGRLEGICSVYKMPLCGYMYIYLDEEGRDTALVGAKGVCWSLYATVVAKQNSRKNTEHGVHTQPLPFHMWGFFHLAK